MKKIYIAYPTAGTVCNEFAYSLARMMGYLAGPVDLGPVRITLDYAQGSNWIENRELIVANAMRLGATHLCFIDDDMGFEHDTLAGMIARDKDIVVTTYPVKEWPADTWTALDVNNERMGTGPERTGLEEAFGSGFGFSLINLDVFRAIPQPWFLPHWNAELSRYSTEDMPFFGKARDAGFKVWLDHDASKKLRHIGKFTWKWDMVTT